MSVQNKVAAGISALSGAMAIGDDVTLVRLAAGVATLTGAMAVGHDADAQIVNVTVGTNFTRVTQGGLSTNNATINFGPGCIGFGSFHPLGGSHYNSSLRGSAPFGISFVVQGVTSEVSSYSAGSVVSANAGVNYFWEPAPRVVAAFTLNSLTPGSHKIYEAFRFGTDASHYDYGWLGVKSFNGIGSRSLVITSIAYAENGASILAGQTTDIPEPASASLLAMGAMALGARGVRRLKKAQAALKKAA